MVEERADVELCIENVAPISDDRARPRRDRSTCIDKVPLSGGAQKETIALDAFVVVVFGGVESKSQLRSPLRRQPLSLGDIGHLLGHARVSLDGGDADGEIPIQEAAK